MKDQSKTKKQLVRELAELRRRIAQLEVSETKRKQAEEVLRESEERYRSVVDDIPGLICSFKPGGVITFVNNEYCDYFGKSRDELIGEDFLHLIPEEGRGTVMANISSLTPSSPILAHEHQVIAPDGEMRWQRWTNRALFDKEGLTIAYQSFGQDITERKKMEEALRDSNEKYRSVIENANVGILVIQDGRRVFHNSKMYEMLGYTDDEFVSIDFLSLVHPGDRSYAVERIRQRLTGIAVTPDVTEMRVLHKSGIVKWIEANSVAIQWEGRPAVQAFVTDITERKQAIEALQQSEERYRQLFEAESDAIFLIENESGRILEANGAASVLYGYSREELLTKRNTDLSAEPEDTRHVTQETPVIADQVVTVPLRFHRKKDGTVFPVEITGRFFEWQGRPVHIAAIRDISERKQAEEERARLLSQIQEQAHRVQQILDTVPEGVLLLDEGERIVLANPVAEGHLSLLTGVKVGDTLPRLGDRPLAELLTSPPRGLWHEAATDDHSFQVIARPIEAGPAPSGWVLVIRDVTQQREIEQRIQQQERLASVGQLAAGIAHDFNNIMATIVLYAQMTARTEDLSIVVRERMETIDQQAEHATRLIQQILDFSRRAVLDRHPLNLLLLLREHVKLLGRTLPESIQVELEHKPDKHAAPLIVDADPTRMQQMVTNLALNARDAMPEGGELHITLQRIEVRPGESPLLPEMAAGEWAQVTMSDTGTGIPPDVLPHIFEPFFTTRAPLGSGLGLAQVHGIVGQHGGRIDVDTQVGEGTTFTIYLPIHLAEPSTSDSAAELSAPPSGQGETILMVEDDAVVRKALLDSLEGLNYTVLEAVNGLEALALLEQYGDDVALVLSDVVMPGMGGIALLHALRERDLMVPVVMLTGHPLEKELEDLRAQGIIDWVPKPPQLEDLAMVVARALGMD